MSSGYIDLEEHSAHRTRKQWGGIAIVTAIFVAVGVASLVLFSGPSESNTTSSIRGSKGFLTNFIAVSDSSLEEKAKINFSLRRVGYDSLSYFDIKLKNKVPKYAILENYVAIIEPSVEMELHLYDEDEIALANGAFKYAYKICTSSGECQESTFYRSEVGDKVVGSVMFSCNAYDTFDIDVYQVNLETGDVLSHDSGKGICLQVRRELRALTDSDLKRFIEVSYMLWNTSDAEGVEKYGSNYHSAGYLLKLHHFNAAQQDADHIHEGVGFLTQHAKITNIFETSLKAIDPSIFLPYWDYTIDDSQRRSVVDSYVMSPNLYGSMFIPTDITKGFYVNKDRIEDGRILDGLWADLKADENTQFPDLNYGYGYMRAPWSMNPSPYISRFTSVFGGNILLPTCQMHYDVMNENVMMEFFYNLAFFPHATVHTLAGGIYGCDELQPLLDSGYIKSEASMANICKSWVFTLKEYYRHNLIIPKKNCVVNEDVLEKSQCGFECPTSTLATLQSSLLSQFKPDINVHLANAATAWSDFLCGGGGGRIFPGDHLESASPTDPSFWVVHPTIERLFHYKLLTGGFDDESWYSDVVKQRVCDKASCYNSTFGYTAYWDHCCYGHFEHDQMLDFESGDRNRHIGPTNAEMLRAGDARSEDYSLPYVYDGFEWDHCTDQDFAGLFSRR